jgi:hypothetical protein
MAKLLLSMMLIASALVAQTTNGRIVGSVLDTSGSVIAGVKVTARNLDTNRAETAETNETGTFVFPNLLIGSYEVTAELQGFKRYARRPIQILVDQTVRVDVQLQLGDVTEQITVDAGAPLIQTDQSSVGQVVDNKTVVELPLNGRNFVRLGSLMPGTTQGAPGDGTRRTRQQGELLTANGARAEHNNFMLDGVENNSAIEGVAVIIPSVDAIQEFKVQTSNYSAEFGRAAGAVVNIAIKSGTNQLHGTAYEFLRNNALDARDFFALGVQPLRRNQFGFSLGGPVVKDRVFLFGNSEWVRERRTVTVGSVVPTAAQRAGNFAGEPTIFDPLAVVGGQRTPFPGNVIPDGRIHPTSRKLLTRWPEVNNPLDRARSYIRTFSNPADQRQLHLRGDVRLSDRDQFMARISDMDSEQFRNALALSGESTNLRPQGGVVSWTRLVSNSMVNEARFSAYMYNFELLPETVGQDFSAELGLPSFALNDITRRHPTISVRNYAGIGGGDANPLLRKEINYQWTDQLTWTRGRHALKIGVDARRYQTNNFQPQTSAGNYVFNGPFTGQVNTQYTSGLADFLLGLPNQQRLLDPSTYDSQRLRNTRLSLYVQDDVNVARNLTLNIGLRWERDGDWYEANNRWAYFDFKTGETVYPKALQLPVTIPFTHRFDERRSMKDPTNKAFAPRFGFAWRPLGGNTTVVRGGYGISWSQPLAFILLNSVLTPPPFLLRTDMVSSNVTPQLQFGNFGFTDSSQSVPRTPSYFTHQPDNFANAYVQQWNFGVEREIAGTVAAKMSYVGSRGVHLERRYQGNAALPPGPGNLNARRLYPGYLGMTQQESSASSWYHSLQVSGEKRFAKGFMFLAGYTWAKALDDSSSWNPNGDSSPFAQNPWDLQAEKGRAAFDVRQRFTLSFVYELPLRTQSRAVNLLVSGWQTAGIATLQTGFPTTVTVGGDIPNAGTGSTRANLNGEGNLPPSERNIDRWFNTAAFSRPAPFTFGTAGRTIIDRPGAQAFDFSLMKFFPITERVRLQFRAEFFNFLNHPVFGGPGTAVDNAATFGTIRGASGGREGQMALKLIF